jgi:hypothetical protein
MEKVYLVVDDSGDYPLTIAGFTTRDAAEAFRQECAEHDRHGDYARDDYAVEDLCLDVPASERGSLWLHVCSDLAVLEARFGWRGALGGVQLPWFSSILGGMWREVVGYSLVVEAQAQSEDDGRAKAMVLAREIKAAVPWGDNEALAKWWSDRNRAICGNL